MLEKVEKDENGKKKVSSFQALMISTASRVGIGNIAGIAEVIGIKRGLFSNEAGMGSFAFKALKHYEQKKKQGQNPVFYEDEIGLTGTVWTRDSKE